MKICILKYFLGKIQQVKKREMNIYLLFSWLTTLAVDFESILCLPKHSYTWRHNLNFDHILVSSACLL